MLKIVDDSGELPFSWNEGIVQPNVYIEENKREWRVKGKQDNTKTLFAPYFIMECCDYNLSEYVKYHSERNNILTDEKLELMIQMCKGLLALHNYTGCKIVQEDEKNFHRDIKPCKYFNKN